MNEKIKKIYERSVKIDFQNYTKNSQIVQLSKKIFLQFSNCSKVKEQQDGKKLLNSLFSNFYHSHKLHKTLAISRTSNDYSDCKINYRQLIRIIDFLLNKEYIHGLCGYKYYKEQYTSVYWATTKISQYFHNVNINDIEKNPSSEIILKDINKKIIKYRGNDFTKALRGKIATTNDLYERSIFSTVLKNQTAPERFYPRLSAIFNDGSFSLGGRLYCKPIRGLSYQNLSQQERSHITIDGEPTQQPDYSGLHIYMAYAAIGIQYEGNPYLYSDKKQKTPYKQAILRLINARTTQSALGSLLNDFPQYDWGKIVKECKIYHSRIKKYFGSGIGTTFQNIDGKMAIDIVSYFANKGIPVLPVHDSFIIAQKYSKELKTVMARIYSQYNNGFSCVIK